MSTPATTETPNAPADKSAPRSYTNHYTDEMVESLATEHGQLLAQRDELLEELKLAQVRLFQLDGYSVQYQRINSVLQKLTTRTS